MLKKKSSILVGSVPEKINSYKFVNRSYLFNTKGIQKSMYDKINLFDVNLNKNEKYFESKNYAMEKISCFRFIIWKTRNEYML